MKTIQQKTILLSLFPFIILFQACSSKNVVSVSETHLYNQQFGLHQNQMVDTIIQQELWAINSPTEVEYAFNADPSVTNQLTIEPDAFLAEDFVPSEPVISYKYKFDKKFYDKPKWRKAEF